MKEPKLTSWKGTFEADRLSGIESFLRELAESHFLDITISETTGFWFKKGSYTVYGFDKDISKFKMDLYEAMELYNS